MKICNCGRVFETESQFKIHLALLKPMRIPQMSRLLPWLTKEKVLLETKRYDEGMAVYKTTHFLIK
jgi:hypothetical protein